MGKCYPLLESNTLCEDGSELRHTDVHGLTGNCYSLLRINTQYEDAVIATHRYTHDLHREPLPIAGKQSVTSPMQSLVSAKRCSIGRVGEKAPIPHPALRDHDVP
jgi:hypothetical protein